MLRLIAITAITAGVAMAECKTYLYQHFDFGGDKKLYTTGNYERVWSNDVVSSIKVVGDGCKAIVYQHFNFGGWSLELPAGSYDQDKLSSMGFKNDEMSSLKVVQECRTYLYEHFDFGGDSKLYTTGDYERVWSNDVVSSIKVVGDGCKAIVYQHFNFGGWNVELPAGSYDQDKLRSMGFKNDKMSSLKVVQECRTYLYEHFNFGGESKLYTTGNYERVWSNDIVSSIKVVGDGCKAIVYEHFKFGGWNVELPAGSYDQDKLRSMGFKNDKMSSLKVVQGPASDGSTTRRLSEMMEAKALEMIDAHAAPVNELMPPPPAF